MFSNILPLLNAFDAPKRVALSRRFPRLASGILGFRRCVRQLHNRFQPIARNRTKEPLPYLLANHQSLLLRQLGTSDSRLQHQKIINLRRAADFLDGLIIAPGETFSLWETIGQPTRKRGFTNGMLLSNGVVTEGIGGGLCQMANLLYWLFLHSPLTVTERHHHSRDVFPDSGRVLPFGSGATIMFNFIDLQAKNRTDQPIQLKIWLTDKHLKGKLFSSVRRSTSYHVYEKNHAIIKESDRHFRYNELWRTTTTSTTKSLDELITVNFAPILYAMNTDYCRTRNFTYYDYTSAYTALKSPVPCATLAATSA